MAQNINNNNSYGFDKKGIIIILTNTYLLGSRQIILHFEISYILYSNPLENNGKQVQI